MRRDDATWVMRWKMQVSAEPCLPGVYLRKDGGFVVRSRIVNPRTGKMIELLKALPDLNDQREAYAWLQAERSRVRDEATQKKQSIPRYAGYATSVLERKITSGEIKSEASREKWTFALEKLIKGTKGVPGFGPFYIDQIRHADVIAWRTGIGQLVTSGIYKPNYVNDWLAIMRVVMKAAVAEFELPRDPMQGIRNFDKALYRTYTREQPNSFLTPEVQKFVSWLKERFPQHFAYALVGLTLGQRECTLRPLRRGGPTPDFIASESLLLIRRSHTRGQIVANFTKTKRDQEIKLPPALVRVIQWHVDTQMTTDEMRASELLFPAEDGRLRGPTNLRKMFEAARIELGLNKKVTGRALRRTFQDLAREAEVDAVITRAISGHHGPAMTGLYSTARDVEVARSIAKVIDLAGVRDAKKRKTARAKAQPSGG